MNRLSAVLILSALATGSLLVANWPARGSATSSGEAKVRLYSSDKVVGEWIAVGPGRVEGDTFVFPTKKGVRDVEVRISGTFSFEQQP